MTRPLIYPDGTNVMLIRAEYVPTEPNMADPDWYSASNPGQWREAAFNEAVEKYKVAKEAAKSKAIRVENAEFGYGHQLRLTVDGWSKPVLNDLKQDSLIPLPSGYTYEVKGVCEACNRVGMRNCAHFDECGANELIALIKPVIVLPEEGEDELWKSVEAEYEKHVDLMTFTSYHHTQFLVWLANNKKYKLTRR